MKYIYSTQDQNIINKIKKAIENRKKEIRSLTGFEFYGARDGVLEYYMKHLEDFEKRANPIDVNIDIPSEFIKDCNQEITGNLL